MCVQITVEVKGVDEIMKENNVEETQGERREREKVEDNSNLCGEVIVEKIVLAFHLLSRIVSSLFENIHFHILLKSLW